VALTVATLLLILRGDQVGVTVAQLSPVPGASDVSSRARIQLTFTEPVIPETVALELIPPLSGRLEWSDSRTAVWVPQPAFTPDTRYTVALQPGVRSTAGHVSREPKTWSFRTRQMRVVFLSEGDGNTPNLWTFVPDTGKPRRLTNEAAGALEFTVSPTGDEIAYNVYHPDGHADLRVVKVATGETRQLLEDKFALAGLLAWSPAGDVIAWERSALTQSQTQTGLPVVGQPRVWLIAADGQIIGPAGRQEGVFFKPVWAPDGTRLAYVDGVNEAVTIFNFTDNPTTIPIDTDGILAWAPDGQHLLVGSLTEDNPPRQRIVRVSVRDRTTVTLTPDDMRVHDNQAAYSPDGSLIGFVRSTNGFGSSHLWIMDADGSNARALTEDVRYKDTAVLWSPDGRYILFGRYPTQGGGSGPELWIADVRTGRVRSLEVSGLLAAWLP
jgi:Tol biopolymer transport system component